MLPDPCRVGVERGAPESGAGRPISEKPKSVALLSNSETKKEYSREGKPEQS